MNIIMKLIILLFYWKYLAYNVLDDNGVILTFRFLAATKFENSNALPFSVQQNQLTTALKFSHPYGVILQSKEKTGRNES